MVNEKPVEISVEKDYVKPDVLACPSDRKSPEKDYRFVAKRDDNWAKKMQEGWEPTQVDKNGKPFVIETHDSKLCEMPKDKAKKRNAFYEKVNKDREDAANAASALAQQSQGSGMPVYKIHAGQIPGEFGKQRKTFAMPNNPLGRQ